MARSTFLQLLAVTVFFQISTAAFTFDNEVRGEPEVQCGQGLINVRVATSRGKPSFIFAKGHFNRPGCFFNNTANATFSFDDCNINRKREINPKGMAYSLMVIVQLHPSFITKVDRAYNVRCFYMEADKSIGAELGVSELTTVTLSEGHTIPQCAYTLHRDSQNGPVVRYASVGDQIFHVWQCPSDVYSMLIHDCFILDGQGTEHLVIDSNGCSTDDFLMPDLSYSADLTKTFTEIRAFNFPDRSSVYFNCQIKLCSKKSDDCVGFSPPQCGVRSTSANMEAELNSDHLLTTTLTPTRATSNPVIFKSTTLAPFPIPDTVESFVEKGRLVVKVLAEPKKHPALLERVDAGEGSGEDEPEEAMTEDIHPGKKNETKKNETRALHVFNRRRRHRSVVATRLSDGILDLDVSSPELTILDDSFDVSRRDREPFEALNGRRSTEICVPIAWLWLIIGFTLLSLVASSIAIFHYRMRFANQKKHVQF